LKRLFVAIDLPAAVTSLLAAMNPDLSGVRWLNTEQMHLTLSFLGNVGASAEEIAEAAKIGAIEEQAKYKIAEQLIRKIV
jgi:2'-5' RNA ligase